MARHNQMDLLAEHLEVCMPQVMLMSFVFHRQLYNVAVVMFLPVDWWRGGDHRTRGRTIHI